MRVEIEISDEEAAALRAWYDGPMFEGWNKKVLELPHKMTLRLTEALPARPIQVGDKVDVEWGSPNPYRAVVLAVEGKYAWLGFNGSGAPFTKPLTELTVAAAGGTNE